MISGLELSVREIASSWVVLAAIAVVVDIVMLRGLWPTPYIMLAGAVWFRRTLSARAAQFLLALAFIEIAAWLFSKLISPLPTIGLPWGVLFAIASGVALRQLRTLYKLKTEKAAADART